MDVFAELVGQERAAQSLRVAANHPGSMTHAWLVTGPPGSGRSNAARAFAAALECEDDGCGTCHSCRTVASGNHPDVTVVRTDKTILTVDEVRGLVTAAARTPSESPWRIIVIEDADRMTEVTSNVLLKALEEPAPQTVWVLCAPSPADVLVTIRSRCRHVGLRIPPAADVAALLVARDGADPDLALHAALAAQSHIGVARRLALDPQARERRARVLTLATGIRGVADAVAAAGELVETAKAEAEAVTTQRDGAERSALLAQLGADEAKAVPPAIRSQIRQLEEDQRRRSRRQQADVLDTALLDLLGFYRDVLTTQLSAGVDLLNAAAADLVAAVAQASSAVQTLHRIDAIATARTRLMSNAAPLLVVEAMMVELRPQGQPAA